MNLFPREDVAAFVIVAGLACFSMGKSDLCLAGAGGSNRASGSRGIPRKSFEAVRGTTAIDDVTVFDIIPDPELLVEQGCFPVVCKWRWQGASGSEGVLRKGPSHRSGKTSVDDAICFVQIAGPEVSMEQ